MIAFLVFAALSAQEPAQALPPGIEPGWVEVGSNAQRRGFVDPTALSREGNRVRMRGRLVLAKPDPAGAIFIDYENEFDCAARSWRVVSFETRAPDGREIARRVAPADQPFQSVDSGTNAATLQERFCR